MNHPRESKAKVLRFLECFDQLCTEGYSDIVISTDKASHSLRCHLVDGKYKLEGTLRYELLEKQQDKREKSTQPEPVLCFPNLNDLIASYVGFHCVDTKEIFETLLAVNPETLLLFDEHHPDLSVESFDVLCPLFVNNIEAESEAKSRGRYYSQHRRSESWKEKREIVAKLLEGSLVNQNQRLHDQLWALCALDVRLWDETFWLARFEACRRLHDRLLFQEYFKIFMKDSRVSDPSFLLDRFIAKHDPFTQEDRPFFLSMFEDNILLASRRHLLNAYYRQDTELQRVLFRSLRLSSAKDPSNLDRWEEAFALFQNHDFEGALNLVTKKKSMGRARKLFQERMDPVDEEEEEEEEEEGDGFQSC
jgi:hypothetical protein